MGVNQGIVIPAIGITAVGVVDAVANKRPVTRIIIGGYLVALFASVLDLFGGQVSALAAGIVWLAFFSVLIIHGPWDLLANLVGTEQQGGTTGGGGGFYRK